MYIYIYIGIIYTYNRACYRLDSIRILFERGEVPQKYKQLAGKFNPKDLSSRAVRLNMAVRVQAHMIYSCDRG